MSYYYYNKNQTPTEGYENKIDTTYTPNNNYKVVHGGGYNQKVNNHGSNLGNSVYGGNNEGFTRITDKTADNDSKVSTQTKGYYYRPSELSNESLSKLTGTHQTMGGSYYNNNNNNNGYGYNKQVLYGGKLVDEERLLRAKAQEKEADDYFEKVTALTKENHNINPYHGDEPMLYGGAQPYQTNNTKTSKKTKTSNEIGAIKTSEQLANYNKYLEDELKELGASSSTKSYKQQMQGGYRSTNNNNYINNNDNEMKGGLDNKISQLEKMIGSLASHLNVFNSGASNDSQSGNSNNNQQTGQRMYRNYVTPTYTNQSGSSTQGNGRQYATNPNQKNMSNANAKNNGYYVSYN